ncbi:MAG TPA: ABC-F family ATP-binding cassette domain-containing protein [Acidimicrobiales bacterium]|nr:ABC-F family ATP-binding cassette domain-containing protein [Acidimicrobiales bacterium]
MILVDAADLAASRPGKPLFAGLSVTVASGDRLAVVGVNGSGKSTLLGILAGTVQPDGGTVRRGRGARVVALDQSATLPEGTVRQAVGETGEVESPGGPEGTAGSGKHSADALLDRVGMAALADADVGSLSGGQAKRAALARALASVGESSEGDLLILDEPTNHLDMDAVAWLEDRLAGFRGGLVLVTHDRHVLDRLTTSILELDRGRAHVHDGGYASYLEARAERTDREAATERKRRNLARAELAWLRRGAPARTRKPKADVAAARGVVDGGPSAAARADDLPLAELVRTPRLGDTVVELHGVVDGYGDHLLFDGVDLLLGPGERLGVIGINGSGKSTLLDLMAGRRTPRGGRVVHGSTVRLGYYDQRGADLPPDRRVREVVAGPTRQPDWTDAALLERLWFDNDAQWAPVRLLSGGERRRLQLALVLRQAPNVLLLDEPTNDLDLDTLRALEDMLDSWPGTLVVVSHDRAFLERTVEDVVVLDGEGRAGKVPGGYAAYESRWRAARRRGRAAAVAGVGTGGGPADSGPRTGRSRSRGEAGRSARSPGARARRTPSTLRHLLRRAEAELLRLQDRQAALEAELAGARGDHVALACVGEELAVVGAELAAAEERWLALAQEAEALGLRP